MNLSETFDIFVPIQDRLCCIQVQHLTELLIFCLVINCKQIVVQEGGYIPIWLSSFVSTNLFRIHLKQ